LGIGNVEYYLKKKFNTMVGFMKNVMGFIKPHGFLHSGIEILDTPGNLTNCFGYREGRV
jgi:hypothetical protein